MLRADQTFTLPSKQKGSFRAFQSQGDFWALGSQKEEGVDCGVSGTQSPGQDFLSKCGSVL